MLWYVYKHLNHEEQESATDRPFKIEILQQVFKEFLKHCVSSSVGTKMSAQKRFDAVMVDSIYFFATIIDTLRSTGGSASSYLNLQVYDAKLKKTNKRGSIP